MIMNVHTRADSYIAFYVQQNERGAFESFSLGLDVRHPDRIG